MKVEDINVVALLVAVIGAGGFGVFFREIASIVTLLRSGVAAKETKRKTDIVGQRDEALRRLAEESDRADTADQKRRRMGEYAARLRVQLIQNGIEPGSDDVWAELNRTVTISRREVRRREQEKNE